jgi:hypothetical protein
VETGEDAYVMWAEGVWTPSYERRLDEIRSTLSDLTPEEEQ